MLQIFKTVIFKRKERKAFCNTIRNFARFYVRKGVSLSKELRGKILTLFYIKSLEFIDLNSDLTAAF